jgi:hypothetical protein
MLQPLPKYQPNRMSKISMCALFCALSVLAFLCPGAIRAQNLSFTLSPNNSSVIQLPSLLAGAGIVEDTILLYSTVSIDTVSITINSDSTIGLLTDTFIIDTTKLYPYPFIITFAPKSIETDSATLFFNFNGHAATLKLTAQGIDTTTDSSTLALSNTANETIAMEYQKDSAVIHVFIKNDFSTEDTISSVTLADPTFFHVLNPPTTLISLPSKDSFEVTLSFNASGSSTHFLKDALYISKPNHPIAPAIALQGLYVPNAAVQTGSQGSVYFFLYPNPTIGLLTIHTDNISSAHATITDVLGRTIQQADFTGDWQWDRASSNGIAPSGTYFVIVSGIGSNGEPVHEVKRVVLE